MNSKDTLKKKYRCRATINHTYNAYYSGVDNIRIKVETKNNL